MGMTSFPDGQPSVARPHNTETKTPGAATPGAISTNE
jgi:hypothetical protein